jgi:hypothetical protein
MMARLRRAIINLVRFAPNNSKIQNGVAILYFAITGSNHVEK